MNEMIPHPLLLPFNRTLINDHFVHLPPDDDPGAPGYWIVVQGDSIWVTIDGGGLPEGDQPAEGKPLFFGTWKGIPCRLLKGERDVEAPAGLIARSLRGPDPELSMELVSLGGMAMQMLGWHLRTRFCTRCGEPLASIPGEWGRKCPSCNNLAYPSVSPCVIVLIRRADEVLLISKPEWPAGRYSLVAGFVDMGECLEEAVARECLEETGIRVKNIEYIGSQSWPFPSQLMAGFVAEYESGEIVVEEKELLDAKWFPVSALPDLPPRRSIARYLIDHFAVPDLG